MNIHLAKWLIMRSSNCNKYANNHMFGTMRECFLIIETLLLGETFGNQTGFIAFNKAICMIFYFKYPFASDGFL